MTHSSKLYVAIEGIDGTGKTNVVNHIAEKYGFSKFQEPSDSDLGRLILNNQWDDATDFFLFMADRANSLRQLDPEKDWVTDRSLYSSYAYQGVSISEKFKSFDEYFNFFMQVAKLIPRLPDYVIILFSDVELALDRVERRGSKSRFERKEYLEKVQKMYFNLKGRMDNIKYVDSNCSLDELFARIDKEITELLQQGHPL